jgi:hypothetical protein
MTSLAIALAGAAALAPAPAAHAERGTNDCYVSISSPYATSSCDYVGVGLYTVIDFTQYSGDIDARVSCTTFERYYDYSTHEEMLTGPTSCHVAIFEYVPGSGGHGSLHIYNKYV